MKKIERMNAIIYILKEKGRVSAKEMAALLEVSDRTVYRDIDALSQIKIPIITFIRSITSKIKIIIASNIFLPPFLEL